jgi:predicted transcriptional regulator
MSPFLVRLTQADHLSGRRGEIFQAICARPGINFEALRDRVRMRGGGGPQYHLYALEKLAYIQSFKVGRYRRYFAAGDEHFRRNKIRAMFMAPAYLETARLVQRRPGASQSEISSEFPEISRQAVGYRLQNLEEAGAIAFYYATMEGGYVLDHLHMGQRAPAAIAGAYSSQGARGGRMAPATA